MTSLTFGLVVFIVLRLSVFLFQYSTLKCIPATPNHPNYRENPLLECTGMFWHSTQLVFVQPTHVRMSIKNQQSQCQGMCVESTRKFLKQTLLFLFTSSAHRSSALI